MNKEKFYTCRYDRAFKEVFMNEKNKDILKELLKSILKVEIKEVRYLNLERNTDNIKLKRKHVDLYLDTDIGKIQVEVNSQDLDYVKPRNTAYLCDIYSHYVEIGKEYDEDTLIIQINLSYGLKDSEYMRKYTIKDSSGKEYVKNFVIYEINMEKYKEIWYSKNTKEIEEGKYIVMLDLEEEELELLSEMIKKDRMVLKYMEEIERVNKSPEFREYISAEEDNRKIENSIKREFREKGLKEGLEEGIQKGIKEGIKEEKLEIAKKMKEKGMEAKLIFELTSLSIEEINNL